MKPFQDVVRGIPVEYSFYSDREPYILNGLFEIDNPSAAPLLFSIRKVWCQVPGHSLPLDRFFVYRCPDFEEADPAAIQQPPHSTVQYEVSFSKIPAVPYLQQQILIGIELDVAGEVVTAFSHYQISRRTRRRR